MELLIQVYIFHSTLWIVSKGWIWCDLEKWGLNYMGSLNVTQHGITCQYWASEKPHPVDANIQDANFPDGSKQEAQNYCRNPDPTKKHTIWCYTTDEGTEWDYCLACPNNSRNYNSCKLPNKGASYEGSVAFTRAQFECDPWIKHVDARFFFADGTALEASNFCRNPDSMSYEGPWCYIKGTENGVWDYCDVCLPFRGKVTKEAGVYLQYNHRLPEQSLHSCIQWCINFLSCVSVDYDKRSNWCFFLTALTGKKFKNDKYDHYSIQRICPERTNGIAGYFTVFPRSGFSKGVLVNDATIWKHCEMYCVNHGDCVMVQMDIDSKCYFHDSLYHDYYAKHTTNTKHITHCNPKLQPKLDIGKALPTSTVEEPAETLSKLKPVVKPIVVADEGFEAAKNSSSNTKSASKASDEDAESSSSSSTATVISMLIIVMTLIGLASSAYGFLKTRRQREEAESKELTLQLSPNRSTEIFVSQ